MALTFDNSSSTTLSRASSMSMTRQSSLKNKLKSFRKELKMHQSKPLPPLPPTRKFNSTSSSPISFTSSSGSTFPSLPIMARSKSVSLPVSSAKQQQLPVPATTACGLRVPLQLCVRHTVAHGRHTDGLCQRRPEDLAPLPPAEYDSTLTSINSLDINLTASSCCAGHDDEDDEEDIGKDLLDVDRLACSILRLVKTDNHEIQWNI
ncbi:hypothetical protein Cantr_06747 [Candida viswanathii]|uniref:Uncharacterized protein n=1 Tax=Candida viswanathii TaxID=5486 RepID=A0A367XYU0_9ASCO|nr:hypothetical protein Cantr_06747 [Candida viswanathii]